VADETTFAGITPHRSRCLVRDVIAYATARSRRLESHSAPPRTSIFDHAERTNMPGHEFNPNQPPPQLAEDPTLKLGASTTLDPNKIFPVRLDTAAFVKKSDVLNGIFGGSVNQIGVVGQSVKNTGLWGDGPTGVYGTSSTATGDGVSGFGRRGVVGESVDFQGVYGHSRQNSGVVGESDAFDGTTGISHASGKSGVFGQNRNGFGLKGHSVSHTGVSGESDDGVGVHGRGGTLAALFEGDVEITGDVRLSNADCAEDFDIADRDGVEPGTVMVLGDNGELHQSSKAYDKRVAGVISGAGDYKPGIVLDRRPTSHKRQPVALLGKVYCKVDAQYGAIEVGDLLTTSGTAGHAMKAGEPALAFGAVIGKALRALKDGRALVPILIALQ
jgi:hypothetical protein